MSFVEAEHKFTYDSPGKGVFANEMVPTYFPKYGAGGFVWYWDVDVEPLLQSVVSLLEFVPEKYAASTTETFLERVHEEFLRRRTEIDPTICAGRTHKGRTLDRSVVPTCRDIYVLLHMIYNIPYKPNLCNANKDAPETLAFLAANPIPFEKFFPQPIQYGSN